MSRKHVVCAWIENAAGEVLLTQRKAGTHLEHLWEFPGGKIEPGETDAAALTRELREELGIDAVVGRELARVEHPYVAKDGAPWTVVLILLEVLRFSGEPRAIDVADLRWASGDWLAANMHLMPPADVPLVAAAQTSRQTRK